MVEGETSELEKRPAPLELKEEAKKLEESLRLQTLEPFSLSQTKPDNPLEEGTSKRAVRKH
jgi:hypothetical protein